LFLGEIYELMCVDGIDNFSDARYVRRVDSRSAILGKFI